MLTIMDFSSRRGTRNWGGRAAALVTLASLVLVPSAAWAEAPPRSGEAKVRSGEAPEAAAVEKEATDAAGEKSYEFQAIEVEGRLKAPQILYFLRRVRAELRAGRLGHRSFLPELADTRRASALR